jgi:nitroreductase
MHYAQYLFMLVVAVSLIAARDCFIKPVLQKTNRKTQFPIDSLILHRWSARALSGQPISDEQLMALFEAARWAPSQYNAQPWHFVYAKRDTEHWDALFNLMVPFNQSWAKNAAALVLIISKDTFDHNGQPYNTHSFDTGAAWQNLALQATKMGLIAHGMAGFDYAKAKSQVGIPDGYTVEALIAIGWPGATEDLPEDMQKSEQPSNRKKIEEFAFEGVFIS